MIEYDWKHVKNTKRKEDYYTFVEEGTSARSLAR